MFWNVLRDSHDLRIRSELRDSNSKLDQIQSVLQDRQEKLHLLERKLLSYAQKLTSSKTTLGKNSEQQSYTLWGGIKQYK